jgi:ankyrin repeat protein
MSRSLPAWIATLVAGSALLLGGCDQGDYASNTPTIKEASATPPAASVDEDVTEPTEPSLDDGEGGAAEAAAEKPEADNASLKAATEKTPRKPTRTTFKSVDPGMFPVKVEPMVVELGEIPCGETGRGMIRLVNTGTEAVTLNQCKTSCGCTTTNCPRGKNLMPDEEVEIDVSLRAGTVGRYLSKKVSLIFNEDQKLDVTVNGQAVEFVAIEPKILDPERHVDGQVIIRSLDEEPFRIVKMTPELLTPDQFSEEPIAEHVLYIDWGKWEELGRNRKLTFDLDHPKANRVLGTVRWYPQKTADGKSNIATPSPRNLTPPAAPQVERIIAAGDIDALSKQLEAGELELTATDRSGASLLALAAKHGQVKAIKMLLERGADINSTDQMGRTPIMTATRAKKPDVIQLLLDEGASIDAQDMLGSSALSWAAGFGDSDSVAILLDAGSKLEVSGTPTGFTPLIWASAFGEAGSVKAIVQAGGNLKATDLTHKMTPLMHASRTGNAEKIRILLDAGAELEARDSSGKTALLVAAGASGAGADMVQSLIEAGADVTATDESGRNALDLARQRTDPAAEKVITVLEGVVKQQPPDE